MAIMNNVECALFVVRFLLNLRFCFCFVETLQCQWISHSFRSIMREAWILEEEKPKRKKRENEVEEMKNEGEMKRN